jgi:hypothetical protein
MTEQNREWSIAEIINGEVPPIPAINVEVNPEPVAPKTARQALVDTITAWSVQYDLPLSEGVDLGTDDDNDLTVALQGLTLKGGDIVPNEREYRFTSTVTITVEVTGTVTASNEDEAHDKAEESLGDICVDGVDLSSWAGDIEVENYDVDNYSVDRISEQ